MRHLRAIVSSCLMPVTGASLANGSHQYELSNPNVTNQQPNWLGQAKLVNCSGELFAAASKVSRLTDALEGIGCHTGDSTAIFNPNSGDEASNKIPAVLTDDWRNPPVIDKVRWVK